MTVTARLYGLEDHEVASSEDGILFLGILAGAAWKFYKSKGDAVMAERCAKFMTNCSDAIVEAELDRREEMKNANS